MKARFGYVFLIFLSLFCFLSCKKDEAGIGGDHPTHSLPGHLYYDWSDEGGNATTYKIDLASGKRSVAIAYNPDLHGWDISRDESSLLTSADYPGDYNSELYMVSNLSNGQTISQFKKQGSEFLIYTKPKLSPDKSLIAVPPTFDSGLEVFNTQGQRLYNVVTIGGREVKGDICWMPDNTIICTVDNTIYRLNADFTIGTPIATLNFSTWNHVTASHDGNKIAFSGGNHIWLMNADGSNLQQITRSDDVEGYPVFSPDGNYLLIGAHYIDPSTYALYNWRLTIIPADGQQYDVTDGADDRVVRVILSGEDDAERSDGLMAWE